MVRLTTPPAAPSVPVFGSLPFIGLGKAAGLGPPPHVRMAQLADQYGDVMELKMGRAPWVVLSSPSAVHEAFVLKGDAFSGRPMVPSMSISSGGGQGFAQRTLTPELASLRRLAFASLFDSAQVARAQLELEDEAGRLAEHLLALTASGGAAELRPALRHCVTNCVLRYTFSARVPFSSEGGGEAASSTPHSPHSLPHDVPHSPQYAELVEVVGEIWRVLTATSTTMTDLLAQPGLATDAAYAPLRALVARRDALLRGLVAARRREARATTAPPRDMLDVLLAAQLTEGEVLYTLVDLFVAGINTVSTSLEWLLLLAAKEPLVQARARADAGYAQALVKEVLRDKPPLLLPRRAVKDASVGGYHIPAGSVVYANNYALAHGERWWHVPSAFRPERWLQEEQRLSAGGAGGKDACKYIPYSIGRRVCPGSKLADAELATVSDVLLRELRWSRASPLDLSEEYSLTLAPARSQSLVFSRAAAAAPPPPPLPPPPPPRRAFIPAASPAPSPAPALSRRAGAPARAASIAMTATARAATGARAPTARGAARSTRRQTLGDGELDEASERLVQAGSDRRGDWRASKAKGVRRNRRYEKRLLRGAGQGALDDDDE